MGSMSTRSLGVSAGEAYRTTHGTKSWRVTLSGTVTGPDGSTRRLTPKSFDHATVAVAFAWGNRPARLEGGVLTVKARDGFVLSFEFTMDGKRMTTDALVPHVRAAQVSRRKREQTDKERVAKLDAELANMR